MISILNNVLCFANKHYRDDSIKFYENNHKYIINDEPNVLYTSVTTWNHSHFPNFDSDIVIENMMKGKGWKEGHKYWGLTPEQIKEMWNTNKNAVAGAGTDLHFEIECFMNNPLLRKGYTHKELYEFYIANCKDIHDKSSIEWKYFINFIKDTPNLKPYRTEWMIFREDLKIAGSVDMIYENPDGTLSIYDWKRSKEISKINTFNKFANNELICHFPDSNFWHYALQLNTYKSIIEEKYCKTVADLYLVRLHPNSEENNYELIKLPDLKNEINDLFLERKIQINKENA